MSENILVIDQDFHLFCTTAKTFPDGIEEAFIRLHKQIPFSENRNYISISRPESGTGIVYRAGATEITKGELSSSGLEEFFVRKGKYLYTTIHHYRDDLASIGRAFADLLQHPDLDPESYCVEWYFNAEDVKCMVRLKS